MPQLLSRKAVQVRSSLMTYLAPKLALDAQTVNLRPLVVGITNKNFASKKAELLSGVTTVMKNKLAKDAELDHLPELLDALERTEEEEAGDNELDGTGNERQTSTLRTGLDAGREFLQSKLNAEDLATYDEICAGEAHDAETPEEKAEREKKEKDAKDAEEVEKEEEDKRAMDAAVDAGIKNERARQNAIREAEKAFRPYIGELAIAFDSAEALYQHGLKAMGVKTKLDGLPLTALQAILESQPPPGARPPDKPLGMDAASSKSFGEMFGTNHMPATI